MSNHSGSYMLNSVLSILEDKYNFYHALTNDDKKNFINDILSIGMDYDCNDGEILEDLGEKLGFCYECRNLATKFTYDICNTCCENHVK